MVVVRNDEEIEKIAIAGGIVKASLDAVEKAIRPGISTWELNDIAERTTLEMGGKPAFKGYRGFPACLCTSVNEEVVHGIPKRDRILKANDIIGIDYGASYQGYFADSARTVPVGFEPSGRLAALIGATKTSLELAIAACKAGGYVQDIGRTIENFIQPMGFGIVEDYVGHGIGTKPHEEPPVPHYLTREKGARLLKGMVICIEPMINMGSFEVRLLDDGWTVVTCDGSLSAHFEHTLAITNQGARVLTA